MTSPSAEADKLRQILNKLQKDMEALKAGSSTQTLDNSAIEVTQGRGYIPILENGVVKHVIGRQPDGTITSVSKNNTTAPIKPNVPVCTPGLASVTVSCSGFGTAQFLDFSHINVYVDGVLTETLMKVPEATVVGPLTYVPHSFTLTSVNLSGTESQHTTPVLCTPNQVVSQDLVDGIISTLKIANDAITAAQIAAGAVGTTEIADNSISTPKVIAAAIQAAQIATGAVSADKVAANAITSDKIMANAVTALQIAANAVTAGAIQAGSVDATKLAAQVILASTAIICGSPTGQRIQLDPTGLFQTDSQGNLSLQFGNTPGGNSLTVIDPTNPTNALASIGSDGTMTMSGFNANGTAILNGVDLVQFLNNTPGGVVAQGSYTGNSPTTTSSIGLFELSFDAIGGRVYQITSDPVFPVNNVLGLSGVYTTDGSVPSVGTGAFGMGSYIGQSNMGAGNSPDFYTETPFRDGGVQVNGVNHNHYQATGAQPIQFIQILTPSVSCRMRILFTVYAAVSGYSTGFANSSGNNQTRYVIYDIGLASTPTGGTNNGGGTTSATGQYTTVWHPTYTAYYGDTSGNTGAHTDQLKQGQEGSTNWMCMLGFNYTDIQSKLSGATVTDIKLFLYSDYWAQSSGGYACVGLHNATGSTPPSSYSFTTRDILDQMMKKPQGTYLDLPNSAGTALKTGTAKGFVLDSRINHSGTGNLGTFKNKDYTDATKQPSLTITYTK